MGIISRLSDKINELPKNVFEKIFRFFEAFSRFQGLYIIEGLKKRKEKQHEKNTSPFFEPLALDRLFQPPYFGGADDVIEDICTAEYN